MTTQWLLTVPSGTDLGHLESQLAPLGVRLEDQEPVPLGDGEFAIAVEGPADLPSELEAVDSAVIAIYPNSELHFP